MQSLVTELLIEKETLSSTVLSFLAYVAYIQITCRWSRNQTARYLNLPCFNTRKTTLNEAYRRMKALTLCSTFRHDLFVIPKWWGHLWIGQWIFLLDIYSIFIFDSICWFSNHALNFVVFCFVFTRIKSQIIQSNWSFTVVFIGTKSSHA